MGRESDFMNERVSIRHACSNVSPALGTQLRNVGRTYELRAINHRRNDIFGATDALIELPPGQLPRSNLGGCSVGLSNRFLRHNAEGRA